MIANRSKSFYYSIVKSIEISACIAFIAALFLVEHADCRAADKPPPKASTETLVDAIVASVDGKPVTLQDVLGRMASHRKLGLKDAALDSEFRYTLDAVIVERLVLEEARARHMDVSDDEIDRYLDQIASRNNLSREGFEKALADEHRDIKSYKEDVRLQILKSKLSSSVLQNGAGVSSDEIKKYIDEHPELSRAGAKMKLGQILVSTQARTEDEAAARINEILEKLKAGADFGNLAKEYSDGPEAQDGGSLGVIAETDLNPRIFEAVLQLKDGEVSEAVRSNAGMHIFKLEERLKEHEEGQADISEQVRKILERQKLEEKADSYFTAELYKNHSVDKKI